MDARLKQDVETCIAAKRKAHIDLYRSIKRRLGPCDDFRSLLSGDELKEYSAANSADGAGLQVVEAMEQVGERRLRLIVRVQDLVIAELGAPDCNEVRLEVFNEVLRILRADKI